MIEIGSGITIGPGVTIGDVPVFITYTYFVAEDGNNLVTQTDDPLVEEY